MLFCGRYYCLRNANMTASGQNHHPVHAESPLLPGLQMGPHTCQVSAHRCGTSGSFSPDARFFGAGFTASDAFIFSIPHTVCVCGGGVGNGTRSRHSTLPIAAGSSAGRCRGRHVYAAVLPASWCLPLRRLPLVCPPPRPLALSMPGSRAATMAPSLCCLANRAAECEGVCSIVPARVCLGESVPGREFPL